MDAVILFVTHPLLTPLAANVVMAALLWLLATCRRDAGLVDLLWPLFFVVAVWIWFEPAEAGPLQWSVLALVMAWGGRLHVHLARRNLGEAGPGGDREDRRYRQMREKHNPGFWWKSFFMVFLLQAVLAWVASLAIFGALRNSVVSPLALAGLGLALAGLVWETVADVQLARFKANEANQGRVLDSGLWGLCRHPNYFGECCFWWGIYLVALPANWWTVISPVLLTVLLLKVSGVTLLERDIGERRPGYRHYMETTPAFVPDFGRLLRRGES